MRRAQWQDRWNLLRKLSPSKVWNIIRVLASYYYSLYRKQAFLQGLPISLSVEPTTACNLRCPECISGLRAFSRPTGMLSKQLFEKTIEELQKKLLYLTFYFQGEPYLHPDFLEMVQFASKKGIYTATSTNAHYLSEEKARQTIASGLDRLIISLDGTTQETYAQYRVGGKLEKVMEGTRNILHWKKQMGSATPYVVWQFLVVRPNEHQIPEVKKLAREIGVDALALKTAQIYDYAQGSDLIPTLAQYSRYVRQTDGTYRIKNALHNQCWKMWHSCVMTWDGRIVPCCFDKDANHEMGQISAQTHFRDIWQSPPYQAFRQSLLRSRSQIEMCQNCTEGLKVWAQSP
ncbi:MAG: radical SAM protein [Microscillaceae bacterium]